MFVLYNIKGKLEIPYYSETADAKVNMAYATEFKSLESNVGKFASIELTGHLAGALAKISKSLVIPTMHNFSANG